MVHYNDVDKLDISEYHKFYKNIKLGKSYGRGVFAAKDFTKNEVLEVAPYIIDKDSAFNDYIFSSHLKDYTSIIVLGYGSIYNHNDDPNVGYILMSDKDDNIDKMYFIYYAKRDIKKDEECKISYGKGWWRSRGIKAQTNDHTDDNKTTNKSDKKSKTKSKVP